MYLRAFLSLSALLFTALASPVFKFSRQAGLTVCTSPVVIYDCPATSVIGGFLDGPLIHLGGGQIECQYSIPGIYSYLCVYDENGQYSAGNGLDTCPPTAEASCTLDTSSSSTSFTSSSSNSDSSSSTTSAGISTTTSDASSKPTDSSSTSSNSATTSDDASATSTDTATTIASSTTFTDVATASTDTSATSTETSSTPADASTASTTSSDDVASSTTSSSVPGSTGSSTPADSTSQVSKTTSDISGTSSISTTSSDTVSTSPPPAIMTSTITPFTTSMASPASSSTTHTTSSSAISTGAHAGAAASSPVGPAPAKSTPVPAKSTPTPAKSTTPTPAKSTTPAPAKSTAPAPAKSATPASASPAAAVTLPKGWQVEMACAVDTAQRVFADTKYLKLSTNSPGACIARCAALGYTMAGVEWENQCFCGSAWRADAPPPAAPPAKCNMKCAGTPGQTCGGGWHIQLYAAPRALPGGWAPVRDVPCAVDTTQRVFAHTKYLKLTTNSPAMCIARCSALGYQMAGVEWENQCFCGNAWRNNKPPPSAPASKCNMKCSGTPGETCGGGWNIQLYHKS